MAANRNQLIHSHIAQSLGHLQSLLAGTIQPPSAPKQAQQQRQQSLTRPLRQQQLAGQVAGPPQTPVGTRPRGWDPGYYAPPGFAGPTPHAPQVPNPATGITPTPQPQPIRPPGPPGTSDLIYRFPTPPVGLNRRPY